jgi:hypothetical protein
VSVCQPASAQKVYARVFTYDSAVIASKYDLTVNRIGPDPGETTGDNDHNTNVFLGATGASVSQNLCASEDWFITFPSDREQMVVDLKYTARSPNEDLNLKLYRDNCLPSAAPVAVANGAPLDGGVRISYDTPDGGGSSCFYFVVGATDPAIGGNTYQLNSVKAP